MTGALQKVWHEDRDLPKIFYGVNSEGMGHAMRVLPVVQRLRERYDVHLFCGGRVKQYLENKVPNVWPLFFIPLIYRDNRMIVGESTARAFARAPSCFKDAGWLWWKMVREQPRVVITDYEFLTMWIGFLSRQKIVCLDNNQSARYAALPPRATPEEQTALDTVVTVSKWNCPFADRTLLSCFYQPGLAPGVDAKKVRFVPCAVRDEVLERKDRVRSDGPVLVYQTSSTNHRLPAVLNEAAARTGLRFHVYGMSFDSSADVVCRSFDDAFLDDLAAAPFVIVNGGHSTIVEALALGKAVLAEPVKGHYEQMLNAKGLEALGTGKYVEEVSVAAIVEFAAGAAAARDKAAALNVVDNDAVVRAVEDAIAEVTQRR